MGEKKRREKRKKKKGRRKGKEVEGGKKKKKRRKKRKRSIQPDAFTAYARARVRPSGKVFICFRISFVSAMTSRYKTSSGFTHRDFFLRRSSFSSHVLCVDTTALAM